MPLSLQDLQIKQVKNVITANPSILDLAAKFGLSEKDLINATVDYNLGPYSNDIYKKIETRFALLINNFIDGSWNQQRFIAVAELLKKIPVQPTRVLDIGYGIIEDYHRTLEKFTLELLLVDKYKSAQAFGDAFCSSENLKLSFAEADLDQMQAILPTDSFDLYILLDSLEHCEHSSDALKMLIQHSGPQSSFILSLPVCEKILAHSIAWETKKDLFSWLEIHGLIIQEAIEVFPNKEVDLFSRNLSELSDVIILAKSL
ncbi:MAG: hypothetical protein QNL04_06640 [SAR324 cluster bacterium]|nr:hypothetical protein [SAR324 cluster bacterium]